MIDYIKCNFECNHGSIGSNFITKTSLTDLKGSSLDTTCGFCTGLDIKGKHNSNIKIRTLGSLSDDNKRIEIQGNLVKWLQGHNLFGISDPIKIINLTIDKLLEDKSLGLEPTQTQLQGIKNGVVRITRLDINRNFHLLSRLDVDRWIVAARDVMAMSYYGGVTQFDKTLYFGKSSQTKELKFYGKGAEIEANKSLPQLLKTPQMLDYANRLLRYEIRLNAKELNNLALSYAYSWSESEVKSLLDTHLLRISLLGNMPISDENLVTLSPVLQSTYHLSVEGNNLRDCLNHSTFYRHKKELLKHDIDISIVLPKFDKPTLNLANVLTDNVVGIPNWAYEQDLVAL